MTFCLCFSDGLSPLCQKVLYLTSFLCHSPCCNFGKIDVNQEMCYKTYFLCHFSLLIPEKALILCCKT